MKKVLLINGYETFEGIGQNTLNKSLVQIAKDNQLHLYTTRELCLMYRMHEYACNNHVGVNRRWSWVLDAIEDEICKRPEKI